ncbi:MAG: hypothetical protein LUE93_12185 [Bacteroides sp.]|nr:hypothetical protein [Bacteroides sp.]
MFSVKNEVEGLIRSVDRLFQIVFKSLDTITPGNYRSYYYDMDKVIVQSSRMYDIYAGMSKNNAVFHKYVTQLSENIDALRRLQLFIMLTGMGIKREKSVG